jgi:hypothetical protein
MATQAELTAVANALLADINQEIATKVPGWEQGMIPNDFRAPLAGELAKTAVNTLDAFRAKQGAAS